MNYIEFKAWFEGMVMGVGEGRTPSLAQWQLLRNEIKSLSCETIKGAFESRDKEKTPQETKADIRIVGETNDDIVIAEVSGEEGESLESIVSRAMKQVDESIVKKGLLKKNTKDDWIKNITGDPDKYPLSEEIDLGGPIGDLKWPFGGEDSNSIISDNDIRELDAQDFGYPPGILLEIDGEYSHEEIIKKIHEIMKKKKDGNNKLH